MNPKDAKRFNDANLNEVKGMKNKDVFEHTTMDELPRGTKIYQSIVNWTSKTNLGAYVKTKCRICFGGHQYNKSYSDTFASRSQLLHCSYNHLSVRYVWMVYGKPGLLAGIFECGHRRTLRNASTHCSTGIQLSRERILLENEKDHLRAPQSK